MDFLNTLKVIWTRVVNGPETNLTLGRLGRFITSPASQGAEAPTPGSAITDHETSEFEEVGLQDFSDESAECEDATNSGEDDEDEDEDDEDEYDEYQERWGPILAIEDNAFEKLANRVIFTDTYQVVKRKEGSYNHAVMLKGEGNNHLVIKVPVVGTKSRWQPAHQVILLSEAHTMCYIKHKLPGFPIAEVMDFDDDLENEIGAPYILQTMLEGQHAATIWFDEEDADFRLKEACLKAEFPSKELEEKRLTLLRSLGKHMAELKALQFDGIGMLVLDNGNIEKPMIIPQRGWLERYDDENRIYWERPVYKSSLKYYIDHLNKNLRMPNSINVVNGLHYIMKTILASSPFAKSTKYSNPNEPESFVLAHEDLNFQNILVSPTGEVTGILDWDMTVTVPRCVGYASVPLFLTEDLSHSYMMPDNALHSPWRLRHYRKVYADAMKEACGGPNTDAMFTQNSALYLKIHRLMFGDDDGFFENAQEMVKNLLLEIPDLRRLDVQHFQIFMERQEWTEAREVLQEWIPKLMDPNSG